MTTRSDSFTASAFAIEGVSIEIRKVYNGYAERIARLDPKEPAVKSQLATLLKQQEAELNPLKTELKIANDDVKALKAQGNLDPVETAAYANVAAKQTLAANLIDAGRSNSNSALTKLQAKIPVQVEEASASTVVVTNAGVKQAEASESAAKTFDKPPFVKNTANSPTLQKEAADAQMQGRSASPLAEKAINEDAEASGSISTEGLKASVGVSQKRGIAHKVFLREKFPENTVYFEVLPEIVEQHITEYEAVQPVQFPGAFQKFKGTATTQWTVNATFISRTSAEATQNYRYLQILRGWTKPFFGERTGGAYPGKLGAPPPVLQFGGLRELIGTVPVVITSLNWNWPRDVDYIPTDIPSEVDGNFIPFPAVMQVPIQLLESYSIDQFNSFSLTDYRAGKMDAAFNTVPSELDMAATDEADDTLAINTDQFAYPGSLS